MIISLIVVLMCFKQKSKKVTITFLAIILLVRVAIWAWFGQMGHIYTYILKNTYHQMQWQCDRPHYKI